MVIDVSMYLYHLYSVANTAQYRMPYVTVTIIFCLTFTPSSVQHGIYTPSEKPVCAPSVSQKLPQGCL